MADVGIGNSRIIQDTDGETATVTNNKLDVNATLVAGATIDIGDVDMFLDGGTAIVGGSGTISAGTLRVTIATDDTVATDLTRIKTAVQILDDWDAIHGGPVVSDGLHVMGEAKVIDGSALPNTVVEGRCARLAISLAGIQYTCLTDDAGASDLGTTITQSLSEIEGAVETIEAAVDTQMQVDVVAISAQSDGTYIGDIKFGEALPSGDNNIGNVDIASSVTLSVNSHAVTNAGTFAVQSTLQASDGTDIGDVDVTSTVQPVGFSSVAQFTTNIGTSATQLDAQACKHADVMAKVGNAGIVYVGGSSVAATTGIALYPGDVYSVEVTNTNLLWGIAISDNDDLQVVYYA